MIGLKTRLALTYALITCLAVAILSFTSHIFSDRLFSSYLKQGIEAQNKEIAASISDQYMPSLSHFNIASVQALGMSYLHEGFIITVKDQTGATIWDARSCDMEKCENILHEIESNMKHDATAKHKLVSKTFAMNNSGMQVGDVVIETLGPIFYTNNEAAFIASLNKLLITLGISSAVLSVGISIFLASRLSKPILQAAATAEKIAEGKWDVRMAEEQNTTELHTLAQSINGLAATLEAGEKWQKRLTSDVAHELRTPLTVLQGNFEAMIDGVIQPTPAQIASCHEEVLRMRKLVDDLKQLSMIEQATIKLSKKEFDLQELLQNVFNNFQQKATSKGISLQYKGMPTLIYADPDRLTQVFVNLVFNAIKFTDSGSVSAEIIEQSESYCIRIKDTGMGIADEEQAQIFERFYRSDKSRSRDTGGAGIGLAIARSIVEAHQGQIQVESKLGQGSCFTITLPKQRPE